MSFISDHEIMVPCEIQNQFWKPDFIFLTFSIVYVICEKTEQGKGVENKHNMER